MTSACPSRLGPLPGDPETGVRYASPTARSPGGAGGQAEARSCWATLDLVPDAHVLIDKTGHVLTANDAAGRLLGTARTALVGRSMTDLLGPTAGFEGTLAVALERAGAPDAPGTRVEITVARSRGSSLRLALSMVRIRLPDGETGMVLCLRETEPPDGAVLAGRVEARILAPVIEDLHAPLQGVLGALGLLSDRALPGEPDRWVRMGLDSAATLLGVVDRLVQLARTGQDNADPARPPMLAPPSHPPTVVSKDGGAGMESAAAADPGVTVFAPFRRRGRPIRLLLVQSNPTAAAISRAMIETAGYHVDTVGDGATALDGARRLPYDLVIVNHDPPDRGGVEVVRRIRALPDRKRLIPIIALSTSVTREATDALLRAGVNDCLPKTSPRPVLLDAIRAWTRYRDWEALGDARVARTSVPDGSAPVFAMPEDLAVIDAVVLRRLAQDTDVRLLPSLAESFAGDVREAIAGIGEAARHADLEGLRHHGHILAGCAPTFGALRLHAVACALENRSLDGAVPAALRLAEDLARESEAALTALDATVAAIVAEADARSRASVS